MQAWEHQSIFSEYLAEEDLVANALQSHRRPRSLIPSERTSILQDVEQALTRLELSLAGQERELHWISQLRALIQGVAAQEPARTPVEQFGQLYHLRKWIFWVPVSLLQAQDTQPPPVITSAYVYATSLALEPLFPDLGSSFCSAMALSPLESVLKAMSTMQAQSKSSATSDHLTQLMRFPTEAGLDYRTRAIRNEQSTIQQPPVTIALPEPRMPASQTGNLSPAFAPSTPQYATPQPGSGAYSSWLEVPITHHGFSHGTQGWGRRSPAFEPVSRPSQEGDDYYGYIPMGYRGGFVQPSPVWT